MVFIESAFWGDERSTKNVTQVLKDKVVGNKLTVEKVDDQLIPAFTVAPKSELTPEDVKKIREQAQKACGSADQDCVKLRTSEFTQAALRERANNEVAEGAAQIIRGKRLTVMVRDEQGNLSRKVVPENGKFELEGLSPTDPRKAGEILPSPEAVRTAFFTFTGVSISTFFWVFSVAATFTLFSQLGWKYGAPVLALIAFLVPNSGYVMIIGYFMTRAFIDNYVHSV
jgi:hypothetical protein